jgi:hypothetical protein
MADPATLYETDFHAWAEDQAARLRAWPEHLRPNGIDIANIAEEIEDLGRSEARSFESLLTQIVLHLLKLELHPAQENRAHWCKEVAAFRVGALKFQPSRRPKARGSPKLWSERDEWAAEAWRDARARFEEELRIDAPDAAPGIVAALGDEDRPRHDLDSQVLRPGWYPEFRAPG